MSTVSIQVQKINVTSVKDLRITDVVDDGNGGFVRAIRVLGEPFDADNQPTLLLEILVNSNTKSDILLDAPGTSY